jgi:transcriptional antiterminator RfaH
MSFWACVQTQSQRERVAQFHIERVGFRSFLPRISTTRRSYGRNVEIIVPLFPSYLFFAVELQWMVARGCPGVLRVVMDGLQPAKVPDDIIAEIRQRENGHGYVELSKRRLEHGDQVRILGGPFAGHLAIYEGMSGPARVAVLLSLFSSTRQVTLLKDAVEPAGPN